MKNYANEYLSRYYSRQSQQNRTQRAENVELALSLIAGTSIVFALIQGNAWIAGL